MHTSRLFTILYGPTASGKSSWALQEARKSGANIVSFDSRHVYQDMDIVTGKDIPEDFLLQDASSPHLQKNPVYSNGQTTLFGFDLKLPTEAWSIAHFYRYAQSILETHRQDNKPLILLGGSWPYANVLIDPPETLFAPVNHELRAELKDETVPALQKRLEQMHSDKWKSMNASDRSNPRRLVRAIETAESEYSVPKPHLKENEYQLILLSPPKERVKTAIAERVISRMQNGALHETETLMQKYDDWNSPAFSATGYKFLRSFLEGRISRDAATTLWTRQEHHYAKKQYTWLQKIQQTSSQAEVLTQ